ncbi:MAG: riboflavin kinase [Sphaerochaeta sp.]|jgi:riboflavin kinase/FMN adenylyltransferase|uniref:riboflavin kinase n=1 Tax=Sphaerochaeta sp. TaxID=1972642 RepID=UPI002A369E54|nr:riboflavin kinase [Sphaerochaeta sp.]MDX9825671.1 riboflavin kinase [Sphaerochaeta sp.]
MRIACGVFDGVHTGHQALLSQKPDIVYVLPPRTEHVLTTVDEKLALIRAFSGSAAQIELVEQLPKICLSDILSVDAIRYKDLPITTERIQASLLAGEIEDAEAMLGYPYTLRGEVVYGRQLGRTVGMPTVNLKTADEKLLPAHGVYGTITIVDGVRYLGVTSIGPRPTVDNLPTVTIETFLLHFNRELYGQHISLELKMYIRPITKFENLEAVRKKVDEDVMYVMEKNLL